MFKNIKLTAITLAMLATAGMARAEAAGSVDFAFGQTSVDVLSGEEFDVAVTMTNADVPVAIFSAELQATEGIEVSAVEKSDRLPNLSFNPATGVMLVAPDGNIEGSEGAVFTVKLRAKSDYSGQAELKLTNIVASTATYDEYASADITLTVNVYDSRVALAFSEEELEIAPGKTASVDVQMTNAISIAGLQAELVLPEGLTATVEGSDRLGGSALYNPATGMLLITPDGIDGEEGTIFTIVLTATNELPLESEICLKDVVATTPALEGVVPAGITLPVVKTVTTGIDLVNAQPDDQIYDLNGRRIGTAQKGVNIVRRADGTVRKVKK